PAGAVGHDGPAALGDGRALRLRRLGADGADPARALLPRVPGGVHAQPAGPALRHRPHPSAQVVDRDEAEPPLGLPVRLLDLPRRAPLLPERPLLQPPQAPPAPAAVLRPDGDRAPYLPGDRVAVVRAEPRAPHGLGATGARRRGAGDRLRSRGA